MSEWTQCALVDFLKVKHGWAFKSEYFIDETGKYPVLVNIGNFKYHGGFRFNETKVKEYVGDYPSEYVLKPGDTLLIMTCQTEGGEILGIPGRIPNDSRQYLHNQRLGKVEIHDEKRASLDFLYWYFLTPEFNLQLVGSASGTKILHTAPTRIEACKISLPPLSEQRAIAGVLSSLDDKIDLLHRQNKTLEALVETLFRQWFVEEAKDDWEEGVLPDEFDFIMGQSPPGESFNEVGDGTPMFQGNADFGFRFPSFRVYTNAPKRFAEPLDTLISVRAPVGAQNMASTKCCIGRGLAAFRYKHNPNFRTYTFYKLRSMMEDFRQFNAEGTVFGSISKSDIQQLKTQIPPRELIEKFEAKAEPVDSKCIVNSRSILMLEKLRDTLLPKLMSGEVRVAYE